MRTTYAVTWQSGREPPQEGRLELQESGLRLDSGQTACEIPYRDVSEVELGQDTIGGLQALTLARGVGAPIRIASTVQAALVSELAERLAAIVLAQRKTSRVIVVVPIKETAREQVRDLLAKGPPFDLEESGIEGHHVFLTDNEVIFIFEALDPFVLKRLAAKLDLLAAAEAWQQYGAGPARIAVEAFSWTRPERGDGLSFAPTPGPGDSEGGDVYPP